MRIGRTWSSDISFESIHVLQEGNVSHWAFWGRKKEWDEVLGSEDPPRIEPWCSDLASEGRWPSSVRPCLSTKGHQSESGIKSVPGPQSQRCSQLTSASSPACFLLCLSLDNNRLVVGLLFFLYLTGTAEIPKLMAGIESQSYRVLQAGRLKSNNNY